MLHLLPLILHELIPCAFGISHSLTKILRTLYIQPPNLHALLHTPWTYRSSAKLIFSQINPPAPELILDAIENPHYLPKLLYLVTFPSCTYSMFIWQLTFLNKDFTHHNDIFQNSFVPHFYHRPIRHLFYSLRYHHKF